MTKLKPPRLLPLLPAFLILFSVNPTEAQSIHGRVLILGDTTGVSGAELTLSDSTELVLARVQTNETGEFRLPVPGAGRFQITASRIGFSPVEAEVRVREEEAVEIELRMAEEAIPLEPIVVVGRRKIRKGTPDEFYDRMARMKQRGKGQFLTREQIEAREGLRLALLLQTIPGVWAERNSVRVLNRSARGGIFCSPEFFIDGQPALGGQGDILPMDLEGVEVYRGFSESVDGVFPNSCGQIFLWRKSDWGNPITWGRAFFALGFAAVVFALSTFF
jgi:hypothetical protein